MFYDFHYPFVFISPVVDVGAEEDVVISLVVDGGAVEDDDVILLLDRCWNTARAPLSTV